MTVNGTSTNGIIFNIEPKSFFPTHVDYVYINSAGEVGLSRPLYDTDFPSLQFTITVRDQFSSQLSCSIDVIIAISRNLFAPTVSPGQQTLSK